MINITIRLKNMIKLKFDEIKAEISRIAEIKDPELCKDEVQALNSKLNIPKLKKVKSGGYYYFYEVEYYYDTDAQHSRERVIEKLGRIEIEDYKKRSPLIDKMKKQGLKNFLEKY
jgi:hypothetical protein